jgi:hypothetical protein
MPRWCRWTLGGGFLLTVFVSALLVPAIQQARNAAKKSNDK